MRHEISFSTVTWSRLIDLRSDIPIPLLPYLRSLDERGVMLTSQAFFNPFDEFMRLPNQPSRIEQGCIQLATPQREMFAIQSACHRSTSKPKPCSKPPPTRSRLECRPTNGSRKVQRPEATACCQKCQEPRPALVLDSHALDASLDVVFHVLMGVYRVIDYPSTRHWFRIETLRRLHPEGPMGSGLQVVIRWDRSSGLPFP